MTRLIAFATAALLVVPAFAGCRGHLSANRLKTPIDTPAGSFIFEYEAKDRPSRDKIEAAILHASPKLAEWGGVREPVTVYILPTHEDLEAAVNRHGYQWLRAWARYDEIFLQSPRTWSVFGAPQADINELVLHELTHSVMYQQSADATHWARKGIPLWFREGMASYTAHQGYRWPTLEDLARFYEENPNRDPVLDPEPLYQHESNTVYGAAHHAFTFLMKRYGAEGVRRCLGQMRGGLKFNEAFEAAFALSQERFTRDFKRFVRLRGFRGGRIHRMREAPATAPTPSPLPLPEPPQPSAPTEIPES